jgi:putative ABC transport system permease protein
MTALNSKLRRDLARLKGQVLTIAVVVACGIAAYVTMHSVWRSLADSRDTYYERYRFADVFARLERAPDAVAGRIEAISGVARAYSRIVEQVMLPMPDMLEPAVGTLVSIPGLAPPALNGVFLRRGRMPIPGRADEAVVLEAFAKAHGLTIGDRIPAVINGNLRRLRVVGIGLSPEYVFTAAPGDFAPDDKRIAVLWMERRVLAAAFRMDGAFNDITLRLQPGASLPEVISRVDAILTRYGGFGAVARDKQPSNFFIEGELTQLKQSATVVPMIFLAVAAFLLNVVLSRMVFLQRTQIASLKALGYSNRAVGGHYLQLVLVIVTIGALVGVVLGAILGRAMTGLYAQYFRFPTLVYRLDLSVVLIAIGVSAGAGTAGALAVVRRVVRLAPAEAMRPPAPLSYKTGIFERRWVADLLGVSSMMVVRELRRRPVRVLLSALGIGAAVGIIIVGRFSYDSLAFLMDTTFQREQLGDMTVGFIQPAPHRVEGALRQLPGVLDVEGMRVVPVRLRHGHRFRDAVISAVPAEPRLRRIVDRWGREVALPERGLALSTKLAEVLDLSIGDVVVAEPLQGDRRLLRLPVVAVVDDAFGLQGYMRDDDVHRRSGQEPSISGVQLRVDPSRSDQLHRRLKELPNVAQVTRKEEVVRRFREQNAEVMKVMTLILTLFGVAIAIGVVYNNARVALSMRSRDLASLRVLGFTRREISWVLLGELAAQMALGIPLGLVLGTTWTRAVLSTVDAEAYRFPVIIADRTYAFAIAIAAVSGLLSALLVRRRLDHLDLVAVLKDRE